MNRNWVIAALMIATGLLPRLVAAHDGHVHKIMGTVTARDARHVEVKTPSGENLSIAITAKTVVTRDKRKISLSEVQTGRRVVVDIGNGEDPLIARAIQVGATPTTGTAGNGH
jgi:hypothetical protein